MRSSSLTPKEAINVAKKKRKRSSYPRTTGRNSHHLLWQRRQWNYGDVKALRSYPYCIVEIPAATLHQSIHEQMRSIPPPSQDGAKRALERLRYLEKFGGTGKNDSIEKRLKVLIAIFDCSEQPTADALRKQLSIIEQCRLAT